MNDRDRIAKLRIHGYGDVLIPCVPVFLLENTNIAEFSYLSSAENRPA